MKAENMQEHGTRQLPVFSTSATATLSEPAMRVPPAMRDKAA